jgi:hypothetical protein
MPHNIGAEMSEILSVYPHFQNLAAPFHSNEYESWLREVGQCRATATIPEIKVHFSSQHADIPSQPAKAFFIIMKRSRSPREVKFGYNPDIRSLNCNLVHPKPIRPPPEELSASVSACCSRCMRIWTESLPRSEMLNQHPFPNQAFYLSGS